MSRFYRVDYRKVSLSEYWNLCPNWKGVVAWLMKIFGHPLPEPNAYPHPSTYKEYEVGEDQLPAEAAAAIAGARKDFEQLGFHSPKWIYQPPLHMNVSSICGTYIHNSGEVLGRVVHTKGASGTVVIEQLTIALLTPFTDGRVLVTTNTRPSFHSAPNVITQRKVGASAAVLYEMHLKTLQARQAEIRKIHTVEECDAFTSAYEDEAFEFNVRRGLYVVLTDEQMAERKNEQVTAQAALADGQRYPKVFAEIDRIQNKKANWRSTLMILALSVAAFVALGFIRWSWETIVILVGVLFFHELGHYLAMRIFKYQNLKMFFIPLFGAAVSGRNYNVKGWQKAVVSLAGPIPGIFVGGILAVFALITDQSWASKVALMALLINGINLLPVLPLDGGWVMHTLLFCRRYWLEGAFHLIAGLVMIAYRFAGGEVIFLFLGMLMLFTSPMAFRLARVAHRLRVKGVSGVSHDQQTIPRETGEAIVDEIKASMPGAHSDKTLASLTLDIFQKLNATPPSIPASLLLFFAYVAPIVLAAVFGGILILGNPAFERLSTPQATEFAPIVADRKYVCNTTRRFGANLESPSVMLISTFDSAALAEEHFNQATNESHDTLTLFGQSVFRSTATTHRSTNIQTVMEYPASNYTATIVMTCTADTETNATALADELQAYFDLAPFFLLVPPWIAQPDLSQERKIAMNRARRTYREIQNIKSAAYLHPEYTKLSKQLFSTFRREKARDRILNDMRQFADDFSQRKLTELKARGNEVDVPLIDLYLREPDVTGEDYLSWWKSVSERIGPAPHTEADLPASANGWFALRNGRTRRDGTQLRFDLSFRQTDIGLPAFADFLCSRACSDIRYTIIGNELEEQ